MLTEVITEQYDGFLVVLRMCHKLRKLADHGGSESDGINEAYVRDDSVKETIVEEAHRFGRWMDLSSEGLPLFLVDVGISMLQLPGESEDEGIARAIEEMNVWDLVPATTASIEALKEVAFDSRWSVAECRRCSKSLAEGKLARMPCSHVFHRECIESWLDLIRMCLVCRFAMPCSARYDGE
ncbi:hypothetical protein RHSIM_Rhsim03G0027300 [Rhododendron simsii]|uniref:RING-type E3 ubiquitin transferase n=1 Tax=Rhododendron simsii TaxID=118357 RepID=A0A834HFZ7_RHOSS|nr:hypothetical protein RHSIM_Rhsim03G0027300 [Rhododendron simsii]